MSKIISGSDFKEYIKYCQSWELSLSRAKKHELPTISPEPLGSAEICRGCQLWYKNENLEKGKQIYDLYMVKKNSCYFFNFTIF